MKVVIVGGVAGGATAAARIRRLDEKAEIIIFEKSGFFDGWKIRFLPLFHRKQSGKNRVMTVVREK